MGRTLKKKYKVAIVHDWLVGGGAELVVLAIHRMYPDAPIYTSYATDEWRKKLDGKVVTGFLQRWPFSKLRKLIPFLRIWWFTHLDLRGYDLVISSSGAEAKGLRLPPGTKHINYCHAPTHYYWSRYDEYVKQPGFGILDPLARFGLWLLVGPLRQWDLRAAKRPGAMIANSTYTQQSIKRYYRRDSRVVFPPVDTGRFAAAKTQRRDGYVIAGRQTPYKRFDLAVQAATMLSLPLTVIGDGPDHARLKAMAGPTITFTGRVSDAELPGYFARAKAFIFPGLDDFGIVAVEAMAAGTPVIAYKAGGSLDYVVPGKTGVFFANQTVADVGQALQECERTVFDHAHIRRFAQRFSSDVFITELTKIINATLNS